MTCPEPGVLVEQRIDRVLTQYRESPKLLHVIRTYLQQAEQIVLSTCDLPTFFQIESAVGEQLTFLGKRLGWPRCHCICIAEPVFGFKCDGISTDFPIVGLCEGGTWIDCGEFGIGEICIDDDELYRKFLYSRLYQILSFYDLDNLTLAIQHLWGPTAWVVDHGHGRVVVSPGRALTDLETAFIKLVPRVLPIAPGIEVRFHFGVRDIFGFGDGWGGFCHELYSDGANISTEDGDFLVTENGDYIITGSMYLDADWMCEIDVKPYDC